ncbi:putative HTH-type transcriptional regulator YfiR [Defluviimonas aquaemixtae]|uniref:Putative HTH-type transcriptional regulator YfiR n=1 Tax=Albidovulum aquaemixtae TaxID=1542388 RepID=A0A2R8BLX9_9RHOB|nr:TetR/AcrR family transcriptional regulator [Defluviimonas aquaemixtae]SPH24425.1 putative HTH-type transcriptional regulator YfiR [Defluviimonas aquaemixtae]
MPYTPEHKAKVRARIVEHARILFNRRGFSEVSIDEIMAEAGLTRGGFYNHFRNKEELYAEAVESFLNGRGKKWRDEAGIDPANGGPETVRAMIDSYLSSKHLGDLDGQCPMIALPSDVARSTARTRDAFQKLLQAMTGLFEHNMPPGKAGPHGTALALSALCVGGMVLSRTLDDAQLADEVRNAARDMALKAAGLG